MNMIGKDVNNLMELESRASLDESKSKDELLVKLNIFDVAFHNLETVSMGEVDCDEKHFQFVPFPCGAFVDLILEGFNFSGQDRTKKFLDVGCGTGTKVMLASVLFDVYGIEYEPLYVEMAHDLGIRNRIGVADAMTFHAYEKFDLIYYYRPIKDTELYAKFESMIHEKMRPGALVAPMHSEHDWDNSGDMEKLSRFWYRKKQ